MRHPVPCKHVSEQLLGVGSTLLKNGDVQNSVDSGTDHLDGPWETSHIPRYGNLNLVLVNWLQRCGYLCSWSVSFGNLWQGFLFKKKKIRS